MAPVVGSRPEDGPYFSEPDLLIAALAALADLIVIRRDTSEFIAAGVPVFNPWDWSLHAEAVPAVVHLRIARQQRAEVGSV